MNNSYNYADFIELSLNSDDDFEPYGYEPQLQVRTYEHESAPESRVEHMLLNHSKFDVNCE